jgi:hypothetical protein
MIITKKALPRRTFLQGMGASLALPLLDAMIPSMTALAKTAANPVRRLGFIYMPMGCDIARWTPPGEGRLGALSPALQSLAPHVDQLTVLTNLELKNAYPGTHATSSARRLPERGQGARGVDRAPTTISARRSIKSRRSRSAGNSAVRVARSRWIFCCRWWAVRQRLRVRLPEQPLMVVPDHAAAG